MKSLNEEQKKAVESEYKFLQVAAGPGTGKTSTIAARILNLQFSYGLQKNEILAISFSKSAKQQLIRKMQAYTEKLGFGSVIEVLTFHSLAHRIIRYGVHHGESKFKKGFQTVDTMSIFQNTPYLIKDLCRKYRDRDLVGKALAKALNIVRQGDHVDHTVYQTWMELRTNKLFKIDIDASERVIISAEDLIECWKRFDRLEKEKNLTDFQGLISESIQLLKKRSDTYEMVTNGLRHILVDEYQDTSLSQEDLLFSLAGDTKDITVVGDKNQTIYTFNGSNETNLDRFIDRCKNFELGSSETIQLNKNYRSTPEIIQLSNYFIGNEVIKATKGKSLVNPVIVNAHSTRLASSYIASEIQLLCRKEQYEYKDVCILFRKNSEHAPQADDVISALEEYDIPYQYVFVKVEQKFDLESSIQELSDNYPGLPLDEILSMVQAKGDAHTDLVEYLKNGVEQGVDDIEELLDLLFEIKDVSADYSENKVTIQSVHSSKGQEYPIVFIVYLGDQHFPHGSHPNIEEEKRLLYVGITRSMEKLYILGRHGIHFNDFLGKCRNKDTEYLVYNSDKKEVLGSELSQNEVILIRETDKALKKQDAIQKKKLEDMMADW
ncbi:ATP-dependent helicase [Neobacillus sp. NPDC058068]|uniref:ATP-dependent helicase n=1 Tax=Neobacillus sp. NPDC058068 TaxID=3346325 RepID=UPI0036DC8A16